MRAFGARCCSVRLGGAPQSDGFRFGSPIRTDVQLSAKPRSVGVGGTWLDVAASHFPGARAEGGGVCSDLIAPDFSSYGGNGGSDGVVGLVGVDAELSYQGRNSASRVSALSKCYFVWENRNT